MKKIFNLSLIILLSINYSFSKENFDLLEGEWLIKEVINLEDNSITRGKYADVNEYLKFFFHKKSLFITTSPLDKGRAQSFYINKKDKTIHLVFPFPIPESAPETVYKINYLSKSTLKLITTGEDGNEILYEFEKLDKDAPDSNITYRTILIKKIIYEKTRDNFVYEYSFLKDENRYLNPIYNIGPTLGTDLSLAVKYPENYPLSKISEELIIGLQINEKGKVDKIDLIKKLNPSIDESVFKFFLNSKWKPLVINGNSVKSEVVLHFRFLLEEGSLF